MFRLLALTGVVVIALVGAGSAQALTEPQSTLLRSLSQTELKALIHDIDAQGLQTSGSTNVKTGVTRMQMAAGRIAAMRTVSQIPIIGTGSVIVWQIADSLGLGGYVYKKITGESYAPTGTGFTYVWAYQDSGSNWGWNFNSQPGWYAAASGGYTYAYCAGGGGPVHANVSATLGGLSGSAFDPTAGPCGADSRFKYRTEAQMEATVQIEPSTAGEYASPPVGATTFSGGTNDTSALTDPELEAALDAIDPSPGDAGTTVEQETAEAILDELDPGWDEGLLLQPLPNETYTAYITRLQDAGYVGTATTTVLTTVEPGYGPEAVVRVIATPVGGTTTVYDPLNWPSPVPTIANNSAITVRYNPDTAPEAPTTTTPTPVTGAPTTIPSAPAVDFSPITELDPGCKFPYGFVCYAVDFTEQFNVSADAPVFSFNIGIADSPLGSIDAGDYTVDLEVMDDYMALWRGLLTVVLWVGAIYLVATRLLGFKAGGDPGEAIDDVL